MLGTPPAFVLSQDQTLELYLKSDRSVCYFFFLLRLVYTLRYTQVSAGRLKLHCVFLCVFSSLYITQVVCFHYTVFKVLSPLSRGDSVILSLLFPFVKPFFKVFSDFFVYNPVQPNMLYYRAPYIVLKYEYQHKLCRYLRLLREAFLYARFPAAYFIKNKSCGEVIHIKLCC